MTPAERAALVERLEKVRHEGLQLDCWAAADEITRLSAEVERLKGQGWKPRETAPKDGSEFIAGSPGWASFSAQWRDGHFVHIDPDDGWIVPPFELWCPLPTPPASQEGQADG